MAGAATMVVIWGNILSFIGNVVALAVEVLVFDAFSLAMKAEKSDGFVFFCAGSLLHSYLYLLAQNSDIHLKYCKKSP